ncbi:hypothetical protein D7030_04340 [Flavobacteriaceae bacterium AU392]|nr:hypothetical protein D1817_10815 [Flavobacteriaceae bacterium]RKM86161.1 hypothetical protein D7030_04340 [Flavobacteriaceae bacterium AU392]
MKLLTSKSQFTAGNTIIIKFTVLNGIKPNLYCTNSYGSTLIAPIVNAKELHYKIPQHISNKSGKVYWKLLNENTSLSGQFHISPKEKVTSMETYIGPPSIQAGNTDYTMAVIIPTDALDNPLIDSTKVIVKHQFLDNKSIDNVFSKNLIAYKNLYSKEKSGRMLVSSESLGINSKEYTVDILPSLPINFNLSHKQNHDFADGNQITSFLTSTIKDNYGNIISDGTYVEFFITNKSGNILKTTGTTINGIATAEMIHPDYEEQWTVKAYINGMAESNTIILDYKQVIEKFEVDFSENNRDISVGPLQSFMQQMIPDGLQVTLSIYKGNKQLYQTIESSNKGFVFFKLKKDIIENDTYEIRIHTADIEKTFNSKKLW